MPPPQTSLQQRPPQRSPQRKTLRSARWRAPRPPPTCRRPRRQAPPALTRAWRRSCNCSYKRLQAFLFCYACAQQHPPTLSPFSLSATADLQQSGHHVLRAAWSPCQTEIQDPFATIHGGFFLFHKNNSKFLQAHSILECFVPASPLIYDVCAHEHLTRCGHTLRCLYPWRSCVLKFLILLKIINDVSMAFSLVHSLHCVTKLFNVIWYRSGNTI